MIPGERERGKGVNDKKGDERGGENNSMTGDCRKVEGKIKEEKE